MSDKYSRPISTRLVLVALFSLGLFYGVSQIPKSCQCHEQGHGDGHGAASDNHGQDENHHGDGHSGSH